MESQRSARMHAIATSFNEHNVDEVLRGFRDDAVYRPPGVGPWSDAFRGGAALRERFSGWFRTYPDCVWHQEDAVVGLSAGVMRWTMEVSDSTGRRHQVPGIDWFDFDNGRVARKDTYIKILPDAAFLWTPKS